MVAPGFLAWQAKRLAVIWADGLGKAEPCRGSSCRGRSTGAIWTWDLWHLVLVIGEIDLFFPTCQVRVVRFYVSLFSSSSSPSPSPCGFAPPLLSVSLSDLNCDPVCSVWRAGPQLRAREFSVACRTPTAILVSSVWRAGPQPRSCEFSVACRTSTGIP